MRKPKLARHRSQSSQILSYQEYNSFSVLRAPDTLSKMDMPMHQEIERSNKDEIQEENYESEYEHQDDMIPSYSMIGGQPNLFDTLQEHQRFGMIEEPY
jgi:hypothetical protein